MRWQRGQVRRPSSTPVPGGPDERQLPSSPGPRLPGTRVPGLATPLPLRSSQVFVLLSASCPTFLVSVTSQHQGGPIHPITSLWCILILELIMTYFHLRVCGWSVSFCQNASFTLNTAFPVCGTARGPWQVLSECWLDDCGRADIRTAEDCCGN